MVKYLVSEIPTFHWADYLLFALSISISGLIGVYIGIIQNKSKTTKDMLVGGKSMHPIPVALSMLASFTSATAILGIPAEMYMFGTMYSLIVIGYLIAGVFCMYCLIPVFHRLDITSSYEYLEKRFGKLVRGLASSCFVIMMLLYMAVVIYAPAIAFSQVTGLSTFITIIGVGIICTFYTAVGGMKAVIYTDSFQMVIILLGLITLSIMGALDIEATAPGALWHKVSQSGRIDFDNFDPTTRHTFWTMSVGGCFMTLTILGTNQAMIQRFLSIKTVKDAQLSIVYGILVIIVFIVIVSVLGLVIFAYYEGCDPISIKQIKTKDQLVPLFTMHIMGSLHGLPGLFTAAVFSGTLSAVSSGINALAAVILTDMVKPAYTFKTGKQLSETLGAKLSKILSMFMGLSSIGLAYLAPLMGDTLLQVSLSLFGMVGGPLLGLFCLAMFFPCCNSYGAVAGLLSSLTVTFWISLGAIINPYITPHLPLSIDQCLVDTNATELLTTLAPSNYTEQLLADNVDDGFTFSDIYKLSYMWYSVISFLTAIIVGNLVSLCTGCTRHEDIEPLLLFSYYTRCFVCFGPFRCDKCCNQVHEKDMEQSLDYKPDEDITMGDRNGQVCSEKQVEKSLNPIKFTNSKIKCATNLGYEDDSPKLTSITMF